MQQTCTSAGTQVLPGLLVVLRWRQLQKSEHQLQSPTLQQAQSFFGSKLMMQRGFIKPFPEMLQNTEFNQVVIVYTGHFKMHFPLILL